MIDKLKKQHKFPDVSSIYDEIIKMLDFKEITKEHVLDRVDFLSLMGKLCRK